jgi:hypothetical protein
MIIRSTDPEKTPFIEVFKMSQIGLGVLVAVCATRSPRVPRSIISDMLVGNPVLRVDAKAVLLVLSECTGITWTLDNVEMALLPHQKEEDDDVPES